MLWDNKPICRNYSNKQVEPELTQIQPEILLNSETEIWRIDRIYKEKVKSTKVEEIRQEYRAEQILDITN